MKLSRMSYEREIWGKVVSAFGFDKVWTVFQGRSAAGLMPLRQSHPYCIIFTMSSDCCSQRRQVAERPCKGSGDDRKRWKRQSNTFRWRRNEHERNKREEKEGKKRGQRRKKEAEVKKMETGITAIKRKQSQWDETKIEEADMLLWWLTHPALQSSFCPPSTHQTTAHKDTHSHKPPVPLH